jgi:phosphoglucosamine mutase
MPQALVNFKIDDKSKLSLSEVVAFIEDEQAKFNGNGRLLIRPSGTEPLARVMVEGDNAQSVAEDIARRLQELVA